MAYSSIPLEQMIEQSFLEGLDALKGLGVDVTVYCPWSAPTRWERLKDNALTFIGWR